MSVELVRGLYDYHRWANRRLFDVARALGSESTRDMGKHFSFPTLKAMFAHIYGADLIWLRRFKGQEAGKLLGDADVSSMSELRIQWDALEEEQRAFVESLTLADLVRPVSYKSAVTGDTTLRLPLGPLLQHVPNHATHHRSEIATMITLIKGSPPDTGLALYHMMATGQLPKEHGGLR